MEKSNRDISALQTITAAASESLELETVLQEVITKITEIFGFDATRIYLSNTQMVETHLKASFEKSQEFTVLSKSFRWEGGIVSKVAETGEPFFYEDIQTDPEYQELAVR